MTVKSALETIENYPLSAIQWITGFLAVLFIRFLLENISNVSTSGAITSDASTLIHYYLFYLYIVLASGVIISWFSGKRITPVLKLLLCGLIITWLPPILDLIVTVGDGEKIAYFFQPLSQLWHNYITYSDPAGTIGASFGVRVEVILVSSGAAWYVWKMQRGFAAKLTSAIITAVLTYTIIFLAGALPSLLSILCVTCSALPGSAADIITFLVSSLSNSAIAQNFLHPTVSLSPERAFETYFNVLVAQVFYIVSAILLLIIGWRADKVSFGKIIGNSRITRVLHYFMLITIGIALAKSNPELNFNWVSILSLAILYISFYCAWMYAVGKNDMADIASDSISNVSRPLITGNVAVTTMENYNTIFLLSAITGAYLVGHNTFFLVLAAIAASYIYSVRPLRLKRIPIVSTFLLGVAGLCASMAGFLFWNADKTARAFHGEYMILIVIGLTLAANIKDLKDIEGDKADGVVTIPVLIGKQWGTIIIGILLFITAGMISLVIGHIWLVGLALIIMILTGWYFRHSKYDERLVFSLYFIFIALCIITKLWT